MALSKINRIVREFTHTTTSQKTVITIDPRTLGMPGGNLYDTLAAGAIAYMVDIVVLRVCGVQTHDGAFKRTVGFSFRGSAGVGGRLLVSPTWADQSNPANYDDYINALTLDCRATGRTSDDASAVADQLNIILLETDLSDFPATYKMFIDIYAYGKDE